MDGLLVISGAPGCGKTTVANILHSSIDSPTVLLPRDIFSVDMTKGDVSLRVPMKDSYKYAIRAFLAAGAFVICEGAFYSEHWRQTFRRIENELSIKATLVYLQASKEVAIERARGRSKADVIDDAYIAEAYGGAHPFGWENEIVIQTDHLAALEVAQRIADCLGVTLHDTLEKRLWHSDSFHMD